MRIIRNILIAILAFIATSFANGVPIPNLILNQEGEFKGEAAQPILIGEQSRILQNSSTSFKMREGIKAVEGPVYMKANNVVYDAGEDSITAEGNIHIIMDNYLLQADKIHYNIEKDLLFAEGNIRIIDPAGRVMKGDRAVFKDKLKRGVIEEFILKFGDNSILVSRLANRLSDNRATLYKSVFTPCQMQCGRNPIWQINAGDTDIDFDRQRISYRNLFFEIYGIPVIYLPYFSHPTPNAPAKSGLLVPKFKHNNWVQPIYFRPKSNLDLTLSPRLGSKYTILEFEARHLLKHGQYDIEGSYGRPPYVTRSANGTTTKDSNFARYHLFAKGYFNQEDMHYGFEVKRASDKAYLKNYHDIYASYLPSRVFVNKIKTSDYFSMEGYYFQELRSEDVKSGVPIIFPSIRTLNVIDLNDEETSYVTVRSNTLTYNDKSESQFIRSALDAGITQKFQSDSGHLFSFTLSNRADLYLLSMPTEQKIEQEKVRYRNIPEISSRWSFPMIRDFNNMRSVKVEPIATVVLGRKYNSRLNKFGIIDSPKYELDNDNIFNSNRFSGIDFHEYGSRLNYGINSSTLSNLLYIDLFLGQSLYKDNVINRDNSEYVGNASVDFAGCFEIFHRFRKDKKFGPIRDEVGIVSIFDKARAGISYVSLNKISRYYSEEGFKIPDNSSKQLKFDIDYDLSDNITIGGDLRLDITGKEKHKTINRTIRMTYTKDCVSISGKLFDDYTEDSARGLKKVRSKTFSLGLKVLNM
jgi:LPS-assembly protein